MKLLQKPFESFAQKNPIWFRIRNCHSIFFNNFVSSEKIVQLRNTIQYKSTLKLKLKCRT